MNRLCIACSTADLQKITATVKLILSHYLGDKNSAMEIWKDASGTNGMLGNTGAYGLMARNALILRKIKYDNYY